MSKRSRAVVYGRQVASYYLGPAVLLGCLGASVSAQVKLPPAIDAGAIQRRTMEQDQRLQEGADRPPAVLKPLDKQALPAPRIQSLTARFYLKHIEFTPSEILKTEDLASLAREFEGREVTMGDLQTLLDKIIQRYRKLGVVTAEPILPQQQVVDGTVKIRLIEGHIGKIFVEGAKDTSVNYVKEWIKQPAGSLPDITVLEQELIRFNRTNDAQLAAELKPGGVFGESDVHMKLIEPPKNDLRFYVDNQGSHSTGDVRTGLMYQNHSLFGLRDGLALNYSRTTGLAGYGVNYSLPINTWGTRLAAAYNFDKTRVVYGSFKDLQITGEAKSYGTDLRHPLYFDSERYLEGSVGFSKREVLSWTGGVELQDMRTADKHLALDWQAVDELGYWTAALTYLSGHAQASDAQGKNYHLTRANFRRVQDLAPGWSLHGTASFQVTGDNLLPSSEQFMIGGEGTVRGYQMGLYSGDSGRVISAELHHPIPLDIGNQTKLSGYFLLDHGITKPYRPVGSDLGVDEINGGGWGCALSYDKWLTSRVTLGIPLRHRPEENKNYYITAQIVATLF
ncbi:MAG: ShlB/FhaC/HecB family hemolysin secretion/activation protein [Leptothrix sp. (in: b-proteobacteria)]